MAGRSEKQLPSAPMFRTLVMLGQRGREPPPPPAHSRLRGERAAVPASELSWATTTRPVPHEGSWPCGRGGGRDPCPAPPWARPLRLYVLG